MISATASSDCRAGFTGRDITLLMPDRDEARALAAETGTKAGEGAATGAVAGGILGGIGGFLLGIGALAIPGVGPFIAAGAFATALGGAALEPAWAPLPARSLGWASRRTKRGTTRKGSAAAAP